MFGGPQMFIKVTGKDNLAEATEQADMIRLACYGQDYEMTLAQCAAVFQNYSAEVEALFVVTKKPTPAEGEATRIFVRDAIGAQDERDGNLSP
jgi:hypothetical protein